MNRSGRSIFTRSLLGVVAIVSAANGQIPGATLTVVAASKSTVDLSWGTGSTPDVWVLERKEFPEGQFFGILTLLGNTSASLTKFDPYQAYTYRVCSEVNAVRACSNEVTVGPPPPGFSTPATMKTDSLADFGRNICLTLDDNDDPMIAYTRHARPASGQASGDLFFVSWDRAHYQWKAPVLVDQVMDEDVNYDQVQVSLARDSSNGVLGIAYQQGLYTIRLQLSSDGGSTWVSVLTYQSQPQLHEVADPSLALAGGHIYLAHFERFSNPACPNSADGIRLHQGTPGNLQSSSAPLQQQCGYSARRTPPSLALDGSGAAALAYWVHDNVNSQGEILLFWRPAWPSEFAVWSTGAAVTNDAVSVSLAFRGAQARMAIVAKGIPGVVNNGLGYLSSDDGLTWAAPVAIPKDGGDEWYYPASLAVSTNAAIDGAAVATAVDVDSGTAGDCGRPKLSRRADGSTSWSTCGPNRRDAFRDAFQVAAFYPSLKFAGNVKVYVAFQNIEPGLAIPAGVILWREP